MKNQNFDIDTILNNAIGDVQTDSVNELLDKYKLNWNVSKKPLMLPDNTPTAFFGVVRSDNNACFSTCKDSYFPFQNTELAELVYRIGEKTGYEIHNGGMFNGGAKIFLQLATGQTLVNGDVIKKYVTAINSHDGTTSVKWGHSNITISCKNTFHAAYRDIQNSARHTDSMRNRIEISLKELGAIAKIEKSVIDSFFRFAEIPMERQNVIDVVKHITDVDIQKTATENEALHSGYANNRTAELLNSIFIETESKGKNLWGLFSGVTHYTSHVIPAPKREHGRIESKYVGSGFKIDNEVYNFLSLETV